MTNLKKFFMLLFIAALLVSGMGFAPRTSASAASCTQYYTVKHGDTLSSIGVYFGVPWQTLAQWNNLANPRVIYAGQTLCVSMSGYTPYQPPSGTIPTITITAVVTNTSVSIKTHNFPANDTFNVLMGTYGTAAVNGTKVGTLASGAGGTLTATYNIPSNLVGRSRIAIRLQSPTSGYFAYNWFWNSTTGGSTGGGGYPTYYSGFPTFSIASVVRNSSVTIHGVNFPANDSFTVTMGPMHTKGIGGYVVGTLNTGAGGSLTATYSIPAALAGSTQISIRAQSPSSGFFAYNWFWNNNAP